MKRLFYHALVMATLFTTTTIYAKTITLYSEPKMDSKVAGTMDTEGGITIVYTPKRGEWIKIANPANGNVGWVKSSILEGDSYNMRIFASRKGAHSYSVYQLDNGNSISNQHPIENEMRNFEQEQLMMQKHIARMLNDMSYFPRATFVPVFLMVERFKSQETPSSTKKEVGLEKAVQTEAANKR